MHDVNALPRTKKLFQAEMKELHTRSEEYVARQQGVLKQGVYIL